MKSFPSGSPVKGPEVTKCGILEANLWRVLWNHLQPKPLLLHLFPLCCLFYSIKTILLLAGWNGGFSFVLVLVVWFCFAWNVWCFKLPVRWLCDKLSWLCHFVVHGTLAMTNIIVYSISELPDVQNQYLLAILHRPGNS